MKNKILVLGASGMVGRIVFVYLSRKNDVLGTARQKQKGLLKYNFPEDNRNLERYISNHEINVVINCVGVLKHGRDFKTNYLLPALLAKLSKKYGFKIINISTDDVYASYSGEVTEDSVPSPNNPYGKSKLKGEIKLAGAINIRTSFIGFDPIGKKGLIEFLINKKGKSVEGFSNQIWAGCTPLQFAILCENLIRKSAQITLHFVPLGPMTKYELLEDISSALRLGIKVVESESEEINRKLTSIYFDRRRLREYTTDTKKAIMELKSLEKTL